MHKVSSFETASGFGNKATNQENDGDVEHEGAETVEEEGEEADVVNLSHGDLGELPNQRNHTVHDGADGGEVVERNQRVHLEVGGAQESLDHGKSESLEDDTSNLVHDTNNDEVDFAHRRNDDTDDNGGDVEELLQVWRGHTQSPAGNQDGDGSGGLEHLNKGNGEVEVCQVTADQTQAEEDANWHDGSQVDAAGHLDSLSAIEKSRPAGQDLRNDGGKGEVVSREDNGIAWSQKASAHILNWREKSVVRIRRGRHIRKLSVSRSHLLNRITEELKPIHVLRGALAKQAPSSPRRSSFATIFPLSMARLTQHRRWGAKKPLRAPACQPGG